jgi:hypothetical protein
MATTIAARVLLPAIFTAFTDHVAAIERSVKAGANSATPTKAKGSKTGDAMDIDAADPKADSPTQV